MTDTEVNSGTVDAAASAAETPAEGSAQEASQETSAQGVVKDTVQTDGGNVTEADKNDAADGNAEEGGDEPSQESGIDYAKLTVPDGVTVTNGDLSEMSKEIEAVGITDQETAQKFVNWVFNKAREVDKLSKEQQKSDMDRMEQGWINEGKKDPEIGKEYEKNVAEARKTVGDLFSPRVVETFEDLRYFSNPDFLKDILRISKERADAELISGHDASSSYSGAKRDSSGNPMFQFDSLK